MDKKSAISTIENSSFEKKILEIQKKFQVCSNPEEKYHLLIDLGRNPPPFDPKNKTEESLVYGCQSQLFIFAEKKEGRLFFSFSSDALISSGLAALLVYVYQGETTETVQECPPQFLQTLGLYTSLSPNRAQGIVHIYIKMKHLAGKLHDSN